MPAATYKYKSTKKNGKILIYNNEILEKLPQIDINIDNISITIKPPFKRTVTDNNFDKNIIGMIKYFSKDFDVNPNVCDGEWFEFKATLSNGQKIKSKGYNYFPKTYDKFIAYLKHFYHILNAKSLNQRCQLLPDIKSQTLKWGGGTSNCEEGETPQFPYVIFTKEVMDWITRFYKLDLIDVNYSNKYNAIWDKKVESLSRGEILTILTTYIRQDRFCEGLFAEGFKMVE
jgi:hypothetical protein